jgi:hypothetical protein
MLRASKTVNLGQLICAFVGMPLSWLTSYHVRVGRRHGSHAGGGSWAAWVADVVRLLSVDVRDGGGREEEPQALRAVPRQRHPRALLRGVVPARGLGGRAPRGVHRGAAGAVGSRHRLLSRGRAAMRE